MKEETICTGLGGHAAIIIGDLNSKLKRAEQQRDALLEACDLAISCMAGYEEMQGWRDQIQAAIAKAKQ